MHSQLQDENDLALVFKHIVQSDDIGMLDFLQDADLPLNVLFWYSSPAGFAAPFLDKFGCIFHTSALMTALLYYCKLATGKKNNEAILKNN